MSGDTINFAAGLTTITLTSNELLIDKSLTISGPGANLLTVQRSTANGTPDFRIFEIINGNYNVTLSGLTISRGYASNNGGGGILNRSLGVVTVTGCDIADNISDDYGGGISNLRVMNIVNSMIFSNSATNGGGGIYNFGTVTLTNSTIYYNHVDFPLNNSCGAGIYNDGGTVNLTSCTVAYNRNNVQFFQPIGGGIFSSGALNTRNTIIANNGYSLRDDVSGTLTSQGFNLIGDSTGAIITLTTGDQIGTLSSRIDPQLGLLQNNGGPTKTLALLASSPAIDTGHSSGLATDQRGFARAVNQLIVANPIGDGSDIGAYEAQANELPIVRNNNDSGPDSLRDVIANAAASSVVVFALSVRGSITLTSGELVINKNLQIQGPGANQLSVQRSTAGGTPAFRIFNITGNPNVYISGLTIGNGNVPGSGGGIANTGTVFITNCTITGNTTSGSNGGGLYNTGSAYINKSTISGNSTLGGAGGGLYNTGTANVTNSTVSGNSASEFSLGLGSGGGIHNSGLTQISNSTISGNTAQFRAGGIINNGTATASNTIIALNTAGGGGGPDVFGALTSQGQGFNLIGNSSGATITPAQASDQIGVTAAQLNLGPLQNNGGPTPTHALLTNSAAIDKGHSNGSTTDQRGFPRPVGNANVSGGDGSDIGAFEVQVLRIDSVTPAAGQTVGGQLRGLAGAFANLSSVTLGGVSATWAYTNGANDTSMITITTPAHAVGAVDIVLTPAAGSTYTKTNAFAYLPTVFTDDTLVAGVTTAKAQHISELRLAVGALRAVAGLGPAPWTDPTLLPASTMIKAVHITELRLYLDQAVGAGAYTDPALSSGMPIKRVHIEELRQRIRNLAG